MEKDWDSFREDKRRKRKSSPMMGRYTNQKVFTFLKRVEEDQWRSRCINHNQQIPIWDMCSDLAWDDLNTLLIWVNKENSIEFLLFSIHYLYNYYMVCALLSHTYHVTYHVMWQCDFLLYDCNYVTLVTWHFPVLLLYSKYKGTSRVILSKFWGSESISGLLTDYISHSYYFLLLLSMLCSTMPSIYI